MRKISRRRFLHTAIALGGGLALPRLYPAKAFAKEVWGANSAQAKRFLTASHWGMYNAVAQNGKLIKIEPFDKDPYPTSMLEGFPSQVYAATRVGHPAVRKGFLEKGAGSDRSGRGREPFVRVSWDHALDLVANELKRVRKKYGNASIFSGTFDWQSAGMLHNAGAITRRLLGMYGGFTDNVGDYSVGCAMVLLPYVLGGEEVYSEQTAWPTILDEAKTLVFWGCCPMKNCQIGTHPSDHYLYGAIEKLKAEKDIDIICVDPRFTDTAKHLGAKWIAPRPNTDTALMLGIAHEMIATNNYDKEFISKYTSGFDKFKEYVLGRTDQTPKTPEWASKITGLDGDTIKDLARRLKSERTMIMAGYAIQRADHGEQPYWMLITLASMIGHIGLPGGGIGFSYHYDNGGDLQANAPDLPGISAGPNPISNDMPAARTVSDMLLNPGKKFPFNGKTMSYPDIKLVYWAGGNPISHQQDINRMLEAWQRPETIIIQDPFWTASARAADIVLPATTGFERNDIEVCGTYSRQFMAAMPQVIKPVLESRNDYDICAAIAKRLGVEEKFTEGKKDQMEWLHSFYAVAERNAKAMKVTMPPFDEFWKRGYAEFPIPKSSKKFVTFSAFRVDPATNALGTASGRIEIFSESIAAMKLPDCFGHPTWIEPVEWLGSSKAARFPLALVSPHPPHRLHSQLDNSELRKTYEVAGREPIWINPTDAKARGIRDGDVVRIFNDRGQVLGGAVVTERVSRSVVCMHPGAWYDPAEPGKVGSLDKHGLVNMVTLDKPASELSQGNVANTALVQIEKYKGAAPPVTIFQPPQMIEM